MEGETIFNMLPGDEGYTLYWAMMVDENRMLWMRGDYPVYPEPQGAETDGMFGTNRFIKIQRTKDGVTVFRASITPEAKYKPGDRPIDAWSPLRVELS